MFDDFHPIELNATTAPNVLSKPSIFDVAVASRLDVFCASTEMSPPASMNGAWIHACALASTTFVTMTAPKPSHVLTRLSSKAVRDADSTADTLTSPPAVTGVPLIDAR